MSQDDLALALALADRADALTTTRFGALDLRIDTKPDLTPVTDADRAVETDLREALGRDRPGDSVLGEEFGGTTTFSGRQWVIDPIDGTKNFVRGVPVWASLIALLHDGVPSVGVVIAPALQRRWWAARGKGAFAAIDGTGPRRLVGVVGGGAGFSQPVVLQLVGVGSTRFARTLRRADRRRVAGAGLRRLSVVLPGGRGSRRHRRRAGGVGVGPGGARHPGPRGRWAADRVGRHPGPAQRKRRGLQRSASSRGAEQVTSRVVVN